MKTKILFFVLIIAHNLQALDVAKTLNMIGNNYGIVNQGTLYNTQGGLDVGYTTGQTISRGYVEFSLANIPTYATITSAQLHLKAFQKYISVATKSTILIKGITNWTLSGLAPEGAWTALNSSATTLYNNAINYYDAIDLTGTALINYISARKSNNIGLGIINKYETTDGIAFSTDPVDLYLKINYKISIPNTPQGITISNITSSGFKISWNDTTARGYNITCNGQSYYTENKEYSFSGLNSATQYPITISSVNEVGSSSIATVIPLTKPLPPTNFLATSSSNHINFTWDASSGVIQGYNIYQGSNTTPVSTTTNLTSIINNLKSNTSYTFTIKSYNQSGESDPLTISVNTTVVPAPYNLTASYYDGYVLLWQNESGTNLGYKIYQLSPQHVLIATINPGYSYMYNYFIGNNLNTNSMYIYGVTAYDENSESGITATGFYTRIQTPKNLVASNITTTSFNIAWNESTGKATGYKIYVDGTYYASTTSNTYSFANLNPGTNYSITVTAYDAVYETSQSVVLIVNTIPLAPTNLQVIYNPTTTEYVLTWTSSGTGISGYNIYGHTPTSGLIGSSSTTSYTIGTTSTLKANTAYVLYVKAYSSGGESPESSTVGFGFASKVKASAPINNSNDKIQTELNLYPNPVVNKLYIDGISQTFDIVVTNLQGQIIKSETKLSNSIDLSELRSGVYIVKIKYDKTEVIRRIIKQ